MLERIVICLLDNGVDASVDGKGGAVGVEADWEASSCWMVVGLGGWALGQA